MKKSDRLPFEFEGYKDSEPKILPIITPPFPEELFSSWILRCSHRHQLKPHVFSKFIWGNTSIWNRDIDKSIKPEALQLICDLNRVSFKMGHQTTLKSYEGILFENLNENGAEHFINTAGIYHRKRKQNALMYCPLCLKKEPYFKKQWRVSLICCCTTCKIYLRDKCPHCGEPVIPFRLNIEKKRLFNDLLLSNCWKCRQDLTNAKIISASPVIIEFTKQIEMKLKCGQDQSDIIFSRLLFLKRVLISNRKLIHYLKSKNICKIPNTKKPNRNKIFEFLEVTKRIEVIKGIEYFLEDWPNNFKVFVDEIRPNYSEFVQGRKHEQNYPRDLLDILKPKTI